MPEELAEGDPAVREGPSTASQRTVTARVCLPACLPAANDSLCRSPSHICTLWWSGSTTPSLPGCCTEQNRAGNVKPCL